MTDLLHLLVLDSARRSPAALAVSYCGQSYNYAQLADQVEEMAAFLVGLGLGAGDRVVVYLEKRLETVVSLYGIAAAGGVLVPVNPLLKAAQVSHILRDCSARVLITSPDRLAQLSTVLSSCPDLQTLILTSGRGRPVEVANLETVSWNDMAGNGGHKLHRRIDSDMAAILYTSGSTGRPKGVVLSHRNLVAGAKSVASYLHNTAEDRILAVLPLSFDYGLSQLSTAFYAGGTAVLMNYLFPRDIVDAVCAESVTGLAGVPALWGQLARQEWPQNHRLRYITNSGGAMPRPVLERLQALLPKTKIYLMYGLTEAFRSTYLPPEDLKRKPDSIGVPIPNADLMVVRPDGTPCGPDEPGELVHRGPLVALGYWNDKERTAERFRAAPGSKPGLPLADIAVWSGDVVRRDEEGYLYFVGRRDDMIKVSGYRISPTEVEEVLLGLDGVLEAAAVGVPDATTGQAVLAVVHLADNEGTDLAALKEACRRELPSYMTPAQIWIRHQPLPKSANGKLDRKSLQREFLNPAQHEARHG